MNPPPHAMSTALYAEWEAVIAAALYGIEAAAQISLVLCVFLLAFRGGVAVLRRW